MTTNLLIKLENCYLYNCAGLLNSLREHKTHIGEVMVSIITHRDGNVVVHSRNSNPLWSFNRNSNKCKLYNITIN